MRRNIYLCQVNNQYGDNVFLPYSVGLLQAYCQDISELRNNYDFKQLIYLRDHVAQLVDTLDYPSVLGLSCYLWNWEYNKALALAVKTKYPDCLVVMGGPQVPQESHKFFVEHSYVDLLVHHEGEITFSEVLLEALNDTPDFLSVPGLTVNLGQGRGETTTPRDRITDLSHIPSPYLTGVFDDILARSHSFQASQETHRGCPYSCTFCDWGSAVFTKVRMHSDERLHAEFEWFGKNKISYLFNCDANYGLMKRDHDLTVKMVDTKLKYGYPEKFRACYAKNSNEKIFEISKLLSAADMNKGVTLSVQSMDLHTLDVIKRRNIKVADLAALSKAYSLENIATYTELIMALPGETYDSFSDGIDELFRLGQHSSLNIYVCTLLPNSEMANPEYVKEHGLKWKRTPLLQAHSKPANDAIPEWNDIVIESDTLPREDWVRCYMFAWITQSMHCLGLARYCALLFQTEHNLSYRDFYERMLAFAAARPDTLIGSEYLSVMDLVSDIFEDGNWDVVIPDFGDVVWPTEEATFLQAVRHKDRFFEELGEFLGILGEENEIELGSELVQDLLNYQRNMVRDPYSDGHLQLELNHNLHSYISMAMIGDPIPLTRGSYVVQRHGDGSFEGDLETFAREIVWYGRKGGFFTYEEGAMEKLVAHQA